jgi:hypothetical protein
MNSKVNILCSISVVLFVISLFLPIFYTEEYLGVVQKNYEFPGWYIIIMSMGLLYPHFGIFFIWFANPLIWLAWYFRKQAIHSIVFSIIASLLALWLSDFTYVQFKHGVTLPNQSINTEPVHYIPIKAFGLGYYFWLFSILIFTIGRISIWALDKSTWPKKFKLFF